MKQVPDRKKLRREYLRHTVGIYGTTIVGMALFTGVLLLLWLLYKKFWWGSFWFLGLFPVLFVIAWIIGTLLGRQQNTRSAKLAYVPPVKPDTIPADEILVRGSEEPPIEQSDVLLRMAQPTQETAKEELLRVSQE